MESMKILDVRVDRVNRAQALEQCVNGMEDKAPFVVVTPNSEIVVRANEDVQLKQIIEQANLVVPDGIGLVIGSKIVKKPLTERVTGIDLMGALLNHANETKKTVYLLGGKPGIAEKAGKNIVSQHPNLILLGTHHGYFSGVHTGKKGHAEEKQIVEEIASQKPDLLFVALGAPGQEYFIDTYKSVLNAKLLMGVGGSLDVISGEVKRAPEFYQKAGLEWLYRLIKEPSRIGRMAALPKFMIKVIFSKKG